MPSSPKKKESLSSFESKPKLPRKPRVSKALPPISSYISYTEDTKTNKDTQKGKTGMNKLIVIGVLLLLGLFLQPVGCVNIKETDAGVKTKKLAGKVETDPCPLGWNFYNRWTDSIETYKVSARSFPGNVNESEKADTYTMELKTADGQNVMVDMTIIYSLRAKEVPLLHQRVGRHFEEEIILPQLRSEARLAFGGYAAEDIYQGKGEKRFRRELFLSS